MTQPTGSNEAPKEQMPWEMTWTEKAKQAITSTIDTAKKAVEGVQMPWERDWKEKPRVAPTPAPEKPVDLSKPVYPTESSMKVAAKLSPQEEARSAARERSSQNIKELQKEIERTKDPKAKKVLTDYMTSLGGTTSQKEIGAGTDKGDAKLKTLLDNAANNSDFKTLYSFLQDKNSLPEMKVDPSIDSRGVFTYGDGMPSSGVLSVGGSSQGYVSTLVHEMTHAADRQMIRLSQDIEKAIRNKEKVSNEEKQFLENWKKSFGARSIGEGGGEAVGMKSLMKSVADPKWLSDNQDYRTTRSESIAHGVGNVNKKASEIYNLQTHMDPSIATEFMILLNQANKISKKRKD